MKRTRRADGPNEDEIRKKGREERKGIEEEKVCEGYEVRDVSTDTVLIECGGSSCECGGRIMYKVYVAKCIVGQDMKPAS